MKKRIVGLLMLLTLVCMLGACTPKATMSCGDLTDTVYTNDSIGMTFQKPAGWKFCTDDEIAAFFANESFDETVIDFMALDPTTGDNIIMSIEKLAYLDLKITEGEYAEAIVKELQGQNDGSNYTCRPTVKAQLGNTEFLMLETESRSADARTVQYIYLKKEGIHMVSVTCTTVHNMNNAESFEKMFS